MHQPHRALAVITLTVVLVAVGCSGSEDDTGAASTRPATTVPATTVAITTVPVTTVPATLPASTLPATTAPGDGAYCLLRHEIDTFGDAVDESQLAEPELARQYFQHQLTLVEQSATVAPAELADDVELYITATTALIEELESNDFNILTADLSSFDTPAVTAARQRLRDYDHDVCGIEPDPEDSSESSEDSSAFDLGDGPIVDQFVAQLVASGFTEEEARCIFGELDFSDPQGLTEAALASAFETCAIDETRLNEIGA